MVRKRVIVIGSNPELQLQRFNHEMNEFNQHLFKWIEEEDTSLEYLQQDYDAGFYYEHYLNGKLMFSDFDEQIKSCQMPRLNKRLGKWTSKKVRNYEIYETFDDYLEKKEFVLNKDRTKVGRIDNPFGQIDDFVLGGRYKNCFVTSSGRKSQARKGEINFDSMKVEAFDEAHESLQAYNNECSKREICHQEAFIKFGIFPEESKEKYYQRLSTICEAVILNEKWIESEDENKKYSLVLDGYSIDEFLEIIKDVGADTLISMYECHF